MNPKTRLFNFHSLRLFAVFLFLNLFGCHTRDEQVKQLIDYELETEWEFRQANHENWKPAKVPGYVHKDLERTGEIDDPFYRANEKMVQWIENEDWEYRTSFLIADQVLAKEHIYLIFEGLDTYASVFLNDHLILEADNQFIPWSADIKNIAISGQNHMLVRFRSPVKEVIPIYDSLGYVVPVNSEQAVTKEQLERRTSVFTRKAQFHYGWDWAPRLVSSGIWRPIHIVGWNDVKIVDLWVKTNSVSDYSANISVYSELISDETTDITCRWEISLEGRITAQYDSTFSITEGSFTNSFAINMDSVHLWWPNGIGDQPIYEVALTVWANGNLMDRQTETFGVREISMVQETDSIGESFYFMVNHRPVFMKGANYVPLDHFFTEVTSDRYDHFFESIEKAHFNMLRVWGGAIYEQESFYDRCDRYGILIWHDFMFSNSMVPGYEDFFSNVEEEAEYVVKMMRRHPCHALWCGNNENLMFWEDRWRNVRNKKGGNELWESYQRVFYQILPEAVKRFDPEKFYWPSSPSNHYNSYHPGVVSQSGNQHFWDVYFGRLPVTDYNKRMLTGRFVSEFGLQSYPALQTVKKFALESDFDVESEVMLQHHKLRLKNGNEIMAYYVNDRYKTPVNFKSTLYVSQLMQAEGIRIAVESFRRNRDKTMGSLYWQANDCWPVTSWSGIDYYGNWKALHYYACHFYNQILLSFAAENGNIKLYGISDLLHDSEGKLDITMSDFSGNVLFEHAADVLLPANKSEIIYTMNSVLTEGVDTASTFVKATLSLPDGKVFSNVYYFTAPKNMKLNRPEIIVNFSKTEEGIELSLRTDILAKGLFLTSESVDGSFSDNYFDLLPGEKKIVTFNPSHSISVDEFKKEFGWNTLWDSYQPD